MGGKVFLVPPPAGEGGFSRSEKPGGVSKMEKGKLDKRTRLCLICEAVRYCQQVQELGMPSSSFSKALREPIYFLWECYDGPKYKRCKYRSIETVGKSSGRGEIVYDHSIEFRQLQKTLLGMEEVTAEKVERELGRYLKPVILTRSSTGLRPQRPESIPLSILTISTLSRTTRQWGYS